MMPRYFFNIEDGIARPDADGTELPSLGAAKHAAVEMSGEIIRESAASFWRHPHWRLTVRDESGDAVFNLDFTAT
jgi:hypothetical protein